jgi:hypothetical protein
MSLYTAKDNGIFRLKHKRAPAPSTGGNVLEYFVNQARYTGNGCGHPANVPNITQRKPDVNVASSASGQNETEVIQWDIFEHNNGRPKGRRIINTTLLYASDSGINILSNTYMPMLAYPGNYAANLSRLP